MAPHDLLIGYLQSYQEGQAMLSFGRWEWKIKTRLRPTSVFVGETDAGNMPVCQGGVNTFGVRLLPDGFVLIADVQTDHVEITWQATLDETHGNPGCGVV